MQLDALAFGAHPDDVELTCGGTLIKLQAQGYRTGVVALSKGELGTRGSVETRAREFSAAAAIMGVSYHRVLDIPDGGIRSTPEHRERVIRELRATRPRIVFAPYRRDRHPDHAGASTLVEESAFLAGLKKLDTGQEAFRPHRVIYYPSRYEFTPSFVVDVSEFHECKMEAIQAYTSQFSTEDSSQVETGISRPQFLQTIAARAREYGSYIGVDYGEPFLVREPLRLDDPVEFFGPEYLNSFL